MKARDRRYCLSVEPTRGSKTYRFGEKDANVRAIKSIEYLKVSVGYSIDARYFRLSRTLINYTLDEKMLLNY